MKTIIIQDREVYTFNGKFYRGGLTEFIKYHDLFNKFAYLAQFKDISESDANKLQQIDDYVKFENLTIRKKINFLFLTKEIKTQLKELVQEYELFIVKMPSLGIGEYIIKEALKQNKKVVVEVVGCAWDSFWYYGIKGKLLAPYNFIKNRYFISKAKYAIYVTKEFLQERYPIQGNSIACSNVYIVDTKRESIDFNKKKLFVDGIRIVTTSPIDIKFRGHSVVFKALQKLKKKNYKFTYYLIGSGNPSILKSLAIKLGIDDSIVFLGKQPHSEINRLLDKSDLYIHPSKAEGLPRALIEAMSRGLPCIAANTAGNPELLDAKYIYAKNSYDELYKILSSLNENELNNMSLSNLEKSKQYIYDVLTDRRKMFYNSIINND